ncbi:hypothetical protein FOA52_003018 [Chlamydomonas sp. UWO 241]|nr:hypothetical protein FOA52_003018 [Chlamydomonas sp. UWO 241]
MSLRDAVHALQGACRIPVDCRLRLDSESTVVFTLPSGTTVSITYTDFSSYPNSGVYLNTGDTADTNNAGEALLALSQRQFAERAPLESVVAEVLKLHGVDAVVPELPDAVEAASDGDEDMEEQSSDNNDNDYGGMSDSGDAAAAGSGDDESDGEEEDEDEREMIINCGKRQGRWERWEEKTREAEAASAAGESGAVAALSHEQASAKKHQIFEPREAFMMLSKELLHIFKQQNFDMIVDSCGDDVYAWSVELAAFDPKGALAKDMAEIQRRHQYSFVKLVLRFKRGLHPFYPPSVQMVRPHFAGSTATAIASHPMLKLGKWDPFRPVTDIIKGIKDFLETTARVDLDHPMNNIARYPASSYRPVEVLLARLSALSGLDLTAGFEPAVQEIYSGYSGDRARMDALASDAPGKRARRDTAAPTARDAKSTVWARGTGYGSGERSNHDPVWDARASEVAQRARDEELRGLLEQLALAASADLRVPAQGTTEAAAAADTARTAMAAAAAALAAAGATASAGVTTRAAAAAPPHAGATTRAARANSISALSDAMQVNGAPTATAAAATTAAAARAAGQSAAAPHRAGAAGTPSSLAATAATIAAAAALLPAPLAASAASAQLLVAADTEEQVIEPDAPACLAALQSSCLAAFLVQELKAASFTDMCTRAPYYLAVLSLCGVLARHQSARETMLLRAPTVGLAPGGPSLAELLQRMLGSARQYERVSQPVLEREVEEQRSAMAALGEPSSSSPMLPKVSGPQQETLSEMLGGLRLALHVQTVVSLLPPPITAAAAAAAARDAAAAAGGSGRGGASRTGTGAGGGGAGAGDGAGTSRASSSEEYCDALRPLQVVDVADLRNMSHAYASTTSTEVQPKARMSRLAKELAGLQQLLPLSECSSIIVRVDEENVTLWRAAIFGPEDTPYSAGCFVFDMYFPPNYPSVPPQVQFKTTGGGRIRFNPNLYNNGKGPPGAYV